MFRALNVPGGKAAHVCARVGWLLPWDAAVHINTSLQRSTHAVCWEMLQQLYTLTTVREWVPRYYEGLGGHLTERSGLQNHTHLHFSFSTHY